MAELKPCPFCGSHNVLLRHYDPYDGYQGDCGVWEAWCVICEANIERRQKEEVIEAWNKRVPETVVNQLGENCTHISNCGTLNLNL